MGLPAGSSAAALPGPAVAIRRRSLCAQFSRHIVEEAVHAGLGGNKSLFVAIVDDGLEHGAARLDTEPERLRVLRGAGRILALDQQAKNLPDDIGSRFG